MKHKTAELWSKRRRCHEKWGGCGNRFVRTRPFQRACCRSCGRSMLARKLGEEVEL